MAYEGYYRRGGSGSIFDGLTLSPLPYPVLLILALISIFLGLQWYAGVEEAVEAAEEQTNWALLAVPILLLLAVRWLSSIEDPSCGGLFWFSSPYDRRRRAYRAPAAAEGSSPWGVAAIIVLLLVLLQFQSSFLDSWLV